MISLTVSLCLSVYLFVCLSSCISQKPHVKISPSFLYVLPVAVASSFFNVSAISCVLPVLCVTCFHVIEILGQNQRRYIRFVEFARLRALGAKSAVSDCIFTVGIFKFSSSVEQSCCDSVCSRLKCCSML